MGRALDGVTRHPEVVRLAAGDLSDPLLRLVLADAIEELDGDPAAAAVLRGMGPLLDAIARSRRTLMEVGLVEPRAICVTPQAWYWDSVSYSPLQGHDQHPSVDKGAYPEAEFYSLMPSQRPEAGPLLDKGVWWRVASEFGEDANPVTLALAYSIGVEPGAWAVRKTGRDVYWIGGCE